jgi:ABC-type bacteriocin/lantibiotic exporter with double-glycine peptidase domain
LTDANANQKVIEQQKSSSIWKSIFSRDLLPHLTELLSVSFFINLLALATPLFVLQVYDRVVFHAGITTLQGLVIGMLLVLLFEAFLKITRIRFFQVVSARNDYSLSKKVLNKIYQLPLHQLESKPFWYWQSLFNDAGMVRNVLGGSVATLLIDLPFSLIFLGVTMIIAPALWWVFIVVLIVFIVLAIVSERIIHHQAVRERKIANKRDTYLSDYINNRQAIKMLAVEQTVESKWSEKQLQTMEASISRGKTVDVFRVISQSMTMLFTVTLTSLGALAILEQQMTIGALIAANMLGSRLINPFVQLVEQWRVLIQFKQALRRIEKLLNEPVDKTDAVVDVRVDEGRFTLKTLRYIYEDKEVPAIHDIDGNIGPNGLHILMGRNGCGKTTLLKLLSGFYRPSQGHIKLDEYDIRQLTSEQLHANIGFLPQHPQLIHGSVYENIALGGRQLKTPDNSHNMASQDEVIAIAKIVDLHDSVTALPNGYDTIINSDNHNLSGGVIQKIALARTLLGNPRVLLLDEPSNNLDQASQSSLFKSLKDYSKTHTVIVASHSPELLNLADTILLLEQGKVAVAGPAQQVIAYLQKQQTS